MVPRAAAPQSARLLSSRSPAAGIVGRFSAPNCSELSPAKSFAKDVGLWFSMRRGAWLRAVKLHHAVLKLILKNRQRPRQDSRPSGLRTLWGAVCTAVVRDEPQTVQATKVQSARQL
jgi:hypothetical protein